MWPETGGNDVILRWQGAEAGGQRAGVTAPPVPPATASEDAYDPGTLRSSRCENDYIEFKKMCYQIDFRTFLKGEWLSSQR